MKWDKKTFVADMREKCSREVAKIGNDICEFSENHAADISWGRGNDHGTLTYRCDSDFGLLPLFHMTSEGQLNLQINFLRSKNVTKQVLRDIIVKLESIFLVEFDEEMYPTDTFEPMNELFHTSNQVEKCLKTIEGCTYRLKQ